ncbi:MAG: metallophosphoesterase family protein [Planctomycetota bacterium]|jgi:3',5'-cyclic AMP phosphodiesterase CpdA
MRILHFSDIHLPARLLSIPFKDWMGKRMIGGANLLLGRARAFLDGHEKIVALDRFRRELEVDLVIFTGDYTALGTRAGLREARKAVEPLMQAPLGYVNVPGNHDVYAFDVLRQKRWEESFGDTFDTDLPHYVVDGGRWPMVRLVGDDVAVVAVNSARPNPQPWRSSGKIPRPQLEALERVFTDRVLLGRFVFVITHYAPRAEHGLPDGRLHGLVNADDFLSACADLSRGAILCGHIHRRFTAQAEGVKPPIFCAGSATKAGDEALWLFDVDGGQVRATPGVWRDSGYALDPGAAVEV